MPTQCRRMVLTSAVTVALTCGAVPGAAAADSQLITDCPHITETGGVIMADTATECATHDNYQYNAAPTSPDFPYPWDDPFYGAALMIGGMGRGPGPADAGGAR